MKTPENHKQLFELWGSVQLQKDLNITRQNAFDMRKKGRIPSKHWAKLLVKARSRGIKLNLTMLEDFDEE